MTPHQIIPGLCDTYVRRSEPGYVQDEGPFHVSPENRFLAPRGKMYISRTRDDGVIGKGETIASNVRSCC